jgi:hypothetical protein
MDDANSDKYTDADDLNEDDDEDRCEGEGEG